ncbi:alpha-L-rhamnosidase [Puteibacter caeruleilacunae]|nr:alpha-L-rhamnosidase [Puteibacter caeruleilacunae]
MIKKLSLLLILFGAVFHAFSIEIKSLQTNYLNNPMGVETARPSLSWMLTSDKNGAAQTAYEIRCAESIAHLRHKGKLYWSTGKVSSTQTHLVKYQGKVLKSGDRIYWQVRVWDQNGKVSKWSEPAFFEMGLVNKSDWKAHWIQANDPDGALRSHNRSPYFQRSFSLKKKVLKARAYVSALGLYELYLNGEKVGEDRLTPGWTSYNNRVQYQTYDVATSLQNGDNVVAAVLGNGWYREFRGQNNDKPLAFIMQLNITYADGSIETIVTDESWQSTAGAIHYTSIYNGELYDARKTLKNWNRIGDNASEWKPAIAYNTKTRLVTTENETMKVMNRLKPVSVTPTGNNAYIIDFGQNLVGVLNMRLNGKGHEGDTVRLFHAEVLDQQGKLYRKALRGAAQKDEYIIAGNELETYAPRFTFHGFRYAEVVGYPGALTADDIEALVIHSDLERTGNFECSEPLINQLFHNVIWGQKGNFVDVPTDCPQRDERLGWTADTQVFTPAGCFNMGSFTFYQKWLKDLTIDQNKDGSVPRYIPAISHGGGQAGWSDAAVIVPWYLYQFYGDTSILADQYASMTRHIQFMKDRAGDNLLVQKGKQYGDWLSFKSENNDHYLGAYTDKYFIATAYFSYSSLLVAKIADILEKEEDAEYYRTLADDVRKAFQNEYMTPNGRLLSNTQTSYCMGIEFELTPDSLKERAAQLLAEDVRLHKHLTTGFLGTPMISFILSDYGYYDEAFMLLMRKKYPGWLYPVTKGATTIWERWDGIKPNGSFQYHGMNSFNHYAYGAIANWLYQVVGGIRINEENAGFSKVIIEPHVGGGLTWAKSSYQSIKGLISSSWKQHDNLFSLDVEVPVNTQGLVRITANKEDKIYLDGHLKDSSQMKYISSPRFKGYEIQIPSGKYHIEKR